MKRSIKYETMPVKSVLNRVKAPSMPFDWSINPYRGCQHGCSFCYARATHTFLGAHADDTFQNHIFMKASAPEALRRELSRLSRSKRGLEGLGKVALGTATDPYQQAEAKARLTRGCLEALADYGVPASITTRSPLILRDLDVLKRLPSVTVNISINTLNLAVWRQFEPSSPSKALRMETVGQLVREGIAAGIFAAPILPYLTDGEQLETLLEAAAKVKPPFLMPSLLRLSSPEVRTWFFSVLRTYYPRLENRYARLYLGGSNVPSEYKAEVLERFAALSERCGLNRTEPFTGSPNASPAQTVSVLQPEQLSFSF